MRRIFLILTFVSAVAMLFGCASQSTYHKQKLPDPKSFNAHFPDMDTDENDQVDRQEFNAYFPQAEPEVFKATDLNDDGYIDHDEWHQFKQAHGLEHQE